MLLLRPSKIEQILFTFYLLNLFIIAKSADRYYYIAAEEIEWDYAPLGRNGYTGEILSENTNATMDMNINTRSNKNKKQNHFFEAWTYTTPGTNRLGRSYKKAVYRRYTDTTFTHRHSEDRRNPGDESEHLGLLGPIIRAVVGDTIHVHFFNNCSRPYSIHPHGLWYSKDSEGIPPGTDEIKFGTNTGVVNPGQRYLYTWEVPPRSGPGPGDTSSIVWLYHSHVEETLDVNSGLIGVIIVSAAGHADDQGKCREIEREFVVALGIFDENNSWYLRDNIIAHGNGNEFDFDDEVFVESNKMHAVNGRIFSNLQGLNMIASERVRWYVVGFGNEEDLHTAHWHGQTVLYESRHTDVLQILPSVSLVADMLPDNPGRWLFHCHVDHHIHAGMTSYFVVQN